MARTQHGCRLLTLSFSRTPIQKWLTQDVDEVDLDGVVEEIVGEDVVEDVVGRARMRRRSGCPSRSSVVL